MSNKLSLAVIFGGQSSEHEVSLMSAASILANLDREKYNIHQVGITKKSAGPFGPALFFALFGLTARSQGRCPRTPARCLTHLDRVDALSRSACFRTCCRASRKWCAVPRGPCGFPARPGTPHSTSSPPGCRGTSSAAYSRPGHRGPWREGP